MTDYAQPPSPHADQTSDIPTNDKLSILYNPTISCTNGKIVRVDALLQGPSAGVSSCQANLIGTVCNQLRQWTEAGHPEIGVSVRVNRDEIERGALLPSVRNSLLKNSIEPERLELTYSERDPTTDIEHMRKVLTELKSIGIRLSLSDFGESASRIGHLARLPLDGLKLAPEVTCDLADNVDARRSVRAIMAMAHHLNLSVAATGVHSHDQLTRLVHKGCDEVQGDLFTLPLPAEKVLEFLLQQGTASHSPWRRQVELRTLLIVDDEQNILSSLKRLLRGAGYQVLTASSAEHGLTLLTEQRVDVILSDQRMPGMSGVEFLRQVKILYPDTVRMVLSGYTDLQSVTDAINEGAIYKFLTKPWDDGILRANIEEAFRRKEMIDDNKRLQQELHSANRDLAQANDKLSKLLDERNKKLKRDETSLGVLHEILQELPWPVLGIDDERTIAFSNTATLALFPEALLGSPLDTALPLPVLEAMDAAPDGQCAVEIDGQDYLLRTKPMGIQSSSSGTLMLLLPSAVDASI